MIGDAGEQYKNISTKEYVLFTKSGMTPTGNSEKVSCWNNQYPTRPGIYILGVNELKLI